MTAWRITLLWPDLSTYGLVRMAAFSCALPAGRQAVRRLRELQGQRACAQALPGHQPWRPPPVICLPEDMLSGVGLGLQAKWHAAQLFQDASHGSLHRLAHALRSRNVCQCGGMPKPCNKDSKTAAFSCVLPARRYAVRGWQGLQRKWACGPELRRPQPWQHPQARSCSAWP